MRLDQCTQKESRPPEICQTTEERLEKENDMTNVPQAREKLNTPVMPFGAHKGKPLDDLRQPLLGAVLHELGRRLAMRPAGQVAP